MYIVNNSDNNHWKTMFKVGGIAAFLQLVSILLLVLLPIIANITIDKPTTTLEYFTLYNNEPFKAFLVNDYLTIILLFLYLFTFYAIFGAMRKTTLAYSIFAMILTFIAVICTFTTHSGFSLMHLSGQYASTVNEAERMMYLSAGEAVMASGMWVHTAGFIGGILLQGSGVLISIVMIRSKQFGILTAISGIIANGFDLTQHIMHPFLHSIADTIIMVVGPVYLIWYLSLGIDLLRMGFNKEQVSIKE